MAGTFARRQAVADGLGTAFGIDEEARGGWLPKYVESFEAEHHIGSSASILTFHCDWQLEVLIGYQPTYIHCVCQHHGATLPAR